MQIQKELEKELTKRLIEKIKNYKGKPITLMEVCGTHTMAISRFGIRSLLPQNIRLVSGPGCPVCVTPDYYMKAAVELANRENVIIATFGDMMRIPAEGKTSLLLEKAKGRDIRIVYSPLDCIELAAKNADKLVIFLSVGFETTIPAVALSVQKAAENRLSNYNILSANKTMPEALYLLAGDSEINVNAFIYPGHVSAIIGDGIYREVVRKFHIPGVIAGFEAIDILGAICKSIDLIMAGELQVANLYSKVVKPEGNPEALDVINRVFEPCGSAWRGLGWIDSSGLRLRSGYEVFDAWRLVEGIDERSCSEPLGCLCGEILKGKSLPINCPHFGKTCTPEQPVGSCMVSSEGTCAAYYRGGLNG